MVDFVLLGVRKGNRHPVCSRRSFILQKSTQLSWIIKEIFEINLDSLIIIFTLDWNIDCGRNIREAFAYHSMPGRNNIISIRSAIGMTIRDRCHCEVVSVCESRGL
jgi:hypothetical protein